MNGLDREGARRLLEAAAPAGRFDPGRAIAPGEDILRAEVLYEPPSSHQVQVPAGTQTLRIPTADRHTYAFADGSVYTWEWHGRAFVRGGTALWCTQPGGGLQVGAVPVDVRLQDGRPARSVVLWAKKESMRLVHGAFGEGRRPLVPSDVVVTVDPTHGTGLSEQEARFVLRTAVAGHGVVGRGLMRFFGGDAARASSAAVDGPLAVVEVVQPSPFGLRVRGPDGRLYGWSASEWDLRRFPAGTRVWATPPAPGVHVVLVGLLDGEAFVLRPAAPASVVREQGRGPGPASRWRL